MKKRFLPIAFLGVVSLALMAFTVRSERDPENPNVWNVVITPENGEQVNARVDGGSQLSSNVSSWSSALSAGWMSSSFSSWPFGGSSSSLSSWPSDWSSSLSSSVASSAPSDQYWQDRWNAFLSSAGSSGCPYPYLKTPQGDGSRFTCEPIATVQGGGQGKSDEQLYQEFLQYKERIRMEEGQRRRQEAETENREPPSWNQQEHIWQQSGGQVSGDPWCSDPQYFPGLPGGDQPLQICMPSSGLKVPFGQEYL